MTTIEEAEAAAQAAREAMKTYEDTLRSIVTVGNDATNALAVARRQYDTAVRTSEDARRQGNRNREEARGTLAASSRLAAWLVSSGAHQDWRSQSDQFLGQLPATRHDLFHWAEGDRGWCETFGELFEEAESAGVLEGLILPEPTIEDPPDTDDEFFTHRTVTAPAFTTLAQVASSELLALAEVHGHRAMVSGLLERNDAQATGELNALANRLPNPDRTRAFNQLRVIRTERSNATASAENGTTVPVARNAARQSARDGLLALAEVHGNGYPDVAALLDRHERGEVQARSELVELGRNLPVDQAAQAGAWLAQLFGVNAPPVRGTGLASEFTEAQQTLLNLAEEHGGREGRRRVQDLLAQVVAEVRGEA